MKIVLFACLSTVFALAQLDSNGLPKMPEKTYESPTLTVRMVQNVPGMTAVYLDEHGDANYVQIDAFYQTEYQGQPVLLHKEAFTEVGDGIHIGTDLKLDLKEIKFIRVKEMKLLKQQEFGRLQP